MTNELQHLLNKVTKVTSCHRHGRAISNKYLDELSNAQVEYEQSSEWIEGIPPDSKYYLASFASNHNKERRSTIKAYYLRQYEIESRDEDTDYDEYCEKDDTYYYNSGWYEIIENWDDYTFVHVCKGEVTHYRPLPEPPKDK